jgi:hypothetical protein
LFWTPLAVEWFSSKQGCVPYFSFWFPYFLLWTSLEVEWFLFMQGGVLFMQEEAFWSAVANEFTRFAFGIPL